MKKLHKKIIAAASLSLFGGLPIIANASPRIPNIIFTSNRSINPIERIDPSKPTPASLLLKLRSNNQSGITTILTSHRSALPTIFLPNGSRLNNNGIK